MESKWNRHNLEQIAAIEDSVSEDLRPVLNAIDETRAIIGPEEQAAALIEAYHLYRANPMHARFSEIGEYFAVAIFKDLRQTDTVQAYIENHLGKRDEFFIK